MAPIIDYDLSDIPGNALVVNGLIREYELLVVNERCVMCTGYGGPCNRFAVCHLAGQPKCAAHVYVTECELCHRGMKMGRPRHGEGPFPRPKCVSRCDTCRAAARKRLVSFYFSRCEDLCDDVLEKVLGMV